METENEFEDAIETEDVDFVEEETADETPAIDWEAKAKELEGRLKRAETKLSKPKPETKEVKKETIEPDYAKIAFLEQRQIAHPDDQKWVFEEAERLKLPLTDILSMEHAKAKLGAFKAQREAMDGMLKGRGTSSARTQNEVDYWLAKGETPEDQELAEKVIDARMNKAKQQNKFSDDLY
jgi:hypothetical protein